MALLIDVIIPVYNGKHYIAPLLDVFRGQGCFSDFRLLFVDDGSADGTGAEIARLAADCPFEVRLISQKNAGVSAARNRGLAEASAPYVAFMDADDRVAPDYMRTLLSVAGAGEADALLFGQQRTDGRGTLSAASAERQPTPVSRETALSYFFADPTRFGAVNLLLRRDYALRRGLRFAEGYAYYEDYHFLISALAPAKTVWYTPAPLYDYVRREGSAMTRFSEQRLTCMKLLDGLRPLLRNNVPALLPAFEGEFLPHLYWSVLWQAALAAPDLRAFLRFAKKTGAKDRLAGCVSHPDKTAAVSSRLFLLSPAAFYTAAAALGKSRLHMKKLSRPAWERLLRALPAGPAAAAAESGETLPEKQQKILIYGMSHAPGGIETYLRTLVRAENAGTFDFLCDFPDIAYRDEMEGRGCRVWLIPPKGRDPVGHLRETRRVLKAHPEYKTVYFNVIDAGAAVTALVPFAMGRKIVVHSHSANTDKPLLHRLCKPLLSLELTAAVACSDAAADHMFPARIAKTALRVPNMVDVQSFRPDPRARAALREALGIAADETVALHVGRLSPEKNPLLLAEIAAVLRQKPGGYRVLSVGDGPLRPALLKRAKALGAEDTLLCLGVRRDIPALFSAADVFILPSLYEGLPTVGVEAQAAGLPCVFSDRVTPEISLTPCAHFLSPTAGADAWANAVEAHKNDGRADTAAALRQAGFDSADAKSAFAALMALLYA